MKIMINIFLCSSFLFTTTCTSQEIVFPATTVETCKTLADEEGCCINFRKCPKAMLALQKGIMPTICGFDGKDPIICCPGLPDDPNIDLLERITQKEVSAPAVNFTCGERGLLKVTVNGPALLRRKRSDSFKIQVFGGKTAIRNSWPWMALLGRNGETSVIFFCSAVVINNSFLITAAHCLINSDKFFVRLGEHDYKAEFDASELRTKEDVEIDSVLLHPKYDIGKSYYDIALIKLIKPVNFRNEVSPICLPWGKLSTEDLVTKTVTVAGWGNLNFGGRQSSILQEANVTVFDPFRCEQSYSTLKDYSTSFPEGLTKENIVCAGDEQGATDACQGDSGGPIMYHESETNTYSLAAIISKGFGCGLKEFPGLYAPIRNQETLQWIKDTAFSQS